MAGKTRIEPGLLVIFQYFSVVAMAYFAVLVAFSALRENVLLFPYTRWSFLNFLLYLVLYAYLSIAWLRERDAGWYLPVALAMATVFPICTNMLNYFESPDRTLPVLIQSSWLSFPVLLVPLLIIAWQYRFRYVVLFILLAGAVEEAMLLPLLWPPNLQTLSIAGQPLIRAFSFGVAGHIVSHLMDAQRAQRRALIHANLELSRNSGALQRLAVSRERNRLARELHDTLAHSLTALSVNLEAMKTELPSGAGLAAMLDRSLQITRNGLTDTRRALKALRADELEDLGLPLAVLNMAETAAARAGLRLETDIDPRLPSLAPAVEQDLFRISQEAVENAIHHAGAGVLRVELRLAKEEVELVIRDDGSGFDPSRIEAADHLGILGMRERAETGGGTLEIESRAESGTTLRVKVPLRHDPRINL
jgi:signal transduction histidine kinase